MIPGRKLGRCWEPIKNEILTLCIRVNSLWGELFEKIGGWIALCVHIMCRPALLDTIESFSLPKKGPVPWVSCGMGKEESQMALEACVGLLYLFAMAL